jgi:hypothetical protein
MTEQGGVAAKKLAAARESSSAVWVVRRQALIQASRRASVPAMTSKPTSAKLAASKCLESQVAEAVEGLGFRDAATAGRACVARS